MLLAEELFAIERAFSKVLRALPSAEFEKNLCLKGPTERVISLMKKIAALRKELQQKAEQTSQQNHEETDVQ